MRQYEPDSKVDICGGKLSPLMLYLPKVTVIACFDYLSAFMWRDNCHVRLQPHATSSVCGWLAVSGHVVLQKRQTLVRMCSRVYHRWKWGWGRGEKKKNSAIDQRQVTSINDESGYFQGMARLMESCSQTLISLKSYLISKISNLSNTFQTTNSLRCWGSRVSLIQHVLGLAL